MFYDKTNNTKLVSVQTSAQKMFEQSDITAFNDSAMAVAVRLVCDDAKSFESLSEMLNYLNGNIDSDITFFRKNAVIVAKTMEQYLIDIDFYNQLHVVFADMDNILELVNTLAFDVSVKAQYHEIKGVSPITKVPYNSSHLSETVYLKMVNLEIAISDLIAQYQALRKYIASESIKSSAIYAVNVIDIVLKKLVNFNAGLKMQRLIYNGY